MDVRNIPLGARKDPADARDRLKRLARATAPVNLPKAARVRHLPKIKNQGMQGSCTGHAAAWFWEQVLASRKSISTDMVLSPLYAWYYGRLLDGNPSEDIGVTMRSSMKAVRQFGICPLWLCEYGIPVDQEPSQDAQFYGKALVLREYLRILDITEIQYSIAIEDQSVCIAFPVFEDWYSDYAKRTGRLQPRTYEDFKRAPEMSWHAMVVCGYDDNAEMLTVANSWGSGYGDGGYLHVPYSYVLSGDSYDAWTAGWNAVPDQKV